MKVTPGSIPHSTAVDKAKGSPTTAKSQTTPTRNPAVGSASNIDISEEAKLMHQATEVAKSAPSVRADKVAALKQAIQNGTYNVDAKALAEKIVDSHLENDFGKNNL